MATVALVVHNDRSSAANLARDIARWLAEREHTVRLLPGDAEVVGRPELAVAPESFTDGCDLAVSLGGDGTMLAVRPLAQFLPAQAVDAAAGGCHVEPQRIGRAGGDQPRPRAGRQ